MGERHMRIAVVHRRNLRVEPSVGACCFGIKDAVERVFDVGPPRGRWRAVLGRPPTAATIYLTQQLSAQIDFLL
jgi:hypothetical protein